MTFERVALGDIGQWYGGGTPSKSNSAFWTEGSIPWLSPKDMGHEVLTDTVDHITTTAVAGSATRLVPAHSVAVVTRSGILERKLPVALVPFETTLNQDMKAVVPRPGVDARWVAWGLRAFERQHSFATHGRPARRLLPSRCRASWRSSSQFRLRLSNGGSLRSSKTTSPASTRQTCTQNYQPDASRPS